MIPITTEQEIVAGREREVETLVSELMANIARSEPGCLPFG